MKGLEIADRPRIMIVEDNLVIAMWLRGCLKELGYELSSIATSGREAIEGARETAPDLVLMDIALEGDMDGTEAAETICSSLDIPVVFITAYADDAVIERAKTAEPFGYLTKPISKEALHGAIAIALHKKAGERALRQAYNELERRVEERTAALREANELLRKEIDEHRLADEKTAQQTSFLNYVLDSLTHPFYVINPETYTIELVNRAAESRGITVGKTCCATTHGRTGTCLGPDHLCPVGEVLETGRPQVIEHVHCDTEGAPRNVEIHAHPVKSPEGEVVGIIEYTLDITERRQAEQQLRESEQTFRSLFESATDLIYLLSTDGTILRANPVSFRLLGYSEQEMIGRAISDYFTLSSQQSFAEQLPALLRGGRCLKEVELICKDGSVISTDCSASGIRDGQGHVTGVVAFLRDATERKQAEKERDGLRNQLFQAQKMEAIGTLAGGIAHDFNNLLQVVLGYAGIISVGKDRRSTDLRNLETIRKAAKDGAELVKGLLTFSRQVESKLRPCDLNLELKRIERLLRRTIPRMIEIKLFLADDLNPVRADPVQVEQVVLNLAVNARHAMPKGGTLAIETANVTLDEHYCRVHFDAKPGNHIQLKISDTGHGMEREVVERIFEPFYTTKKAGEGTGLGLSVVYGIVKSHGGHITCSSEPGIGATFNIYLPANVVDRPPEVDLMHEMPAWGTETILVVDDERHIRNVVEESLTLHGYKVHLAATGKEALESYRAKQEAIDLVLLDLILPEMGGEQCLEEILTINPHAKVLIASGYSTEESRKALLELGASGFMDKPFEAIELLRTVRNTLDKAGLRGGPSHGSGVISAQSTTGKGSIAAVTPGLSEASQAHTMVDIEKLPWKLRILAIDDREPYLKMLEAGLAQFGQIPYTAASGMEGLQLFQEAPVDLVVCDLGMPEMDGWQVGKRIKEICREKAVPKTPFILLTGQAEKEETDQEDRKKMAHCGVDAIVGKPIDIPDLLEVVERLMKQKGREDSEHSGPS